MWLWFLFSFVTASVLLVVFKRYSNSNPYAGRTGTTIPQCTSYNLDEEIKEAIYMAIAKNDGKEMGLILKAKRKGFNIDRANSRRPYLCVASRQGKHKAVEQLLLFGADPDVKDAQGNTPLVMAARNGFMKTIELLITHNASVDEKSGRMMNMTALHWAAANGRAEVAECNKALNFNSSSTDLLKKGASLDLQTASGLYPLHKCCENSHFNTVKLMLEYGADPNVYDSHNETPLHKCARSNTHECAILLLEKGANFDTTSEASGSIFVVAAIQGHDKFISHVLRYINDEQQTVKAITAIVDRLLSGDTDDGKTISNLRNTILQLSLEYGDVVSKSVIDHLIETGQNVISASGAHGSAQMDIQKRNLRKISQTFVNLSLFILSTEGSKSERWNRFNAETERLESLWLYLDKFFQEIQYRYREREEGDSVDAKKEKEMYTDLDFTTLTPILETFSAFSRAIEPSYIHNSSSSVTTTTTTTKGEWKLSNEKFYLFIDKYHKIISKIAESNKDLLLGPLDFLLENSTQSARWGVSHVIASLDFNQKTTWLKRKLAEDAQHLMGVKGLNFSVSRSSVLDNSCKSIVQGPINELKAKLWVKFDGEEGVGAGPIREWFSLISQEIFNVQNALFELSADGVTFLPSSKSHVNPDHLSYFKFIGRVIGMAIWQEQPLDVHFTKSLYKQMLGLPFDIHDLQSIDPDFHKNLTWILENDIDDMDLDLTFTVDENDFGVHKQIDLVEDGKKIMVTDANKENYVELLVEYKIKKGIEEQIENFLEGFHELIPLNWVAIFTPNELELLISGLPTIDIDDWKKNTAYTGFTEDSTQVKWFWQWVESLSVPDKALLLQFTCGSSCVPLGGFSNLQGLEGPSKFTIFKSTENASQLPTATTCYNIIKLPEYESYDKLAKMCYTAISHGHSGFTFN